MFKFNNGFLVWKFCGKAVSVENVPLHKIPKPGWHCSGIFVVNFEHISHLVLVFLL